MDRFERRAAEIMRLGEKRIAEKKRRNTIIRRSAVSSGACAAAIAGVWLMSGRNLREAAKPPHTELMIVETTAPTDAPPAAEISQTTAVPSPTVTGTVPSTERQAPARTESTPSVSSETVDIPSVTTATPVTRPYVTDPGTTAAVTTVVTQTQTAASPATTESPAVTTTPKTENLYDPRKTYTFELDGITYEVSGEAADPEFFQSIDPIEYTEMLTEDDSGNITSVKGCIANAQPLSEMVSFQILCVVETENGQEFYIAHPIN